MSEVRAGGAVLWRKNSDDGDIAVALVHRPRYDDWSLPKGKLDPGETVPAAAAREVLEETGFHAVLGRHLRTVRYRVAGRAKTVDYFSAEARDGRFEPNDEVDELRWLSPAQAESELSYDADVDVLRGFTALPAELTTLLLVRHAKAGKRAEWSGDDDLRPLSPAGLRQAEALRKLARVFGADRVFSAPRLRCVQTVQGIAEDLGLPVRQEPLLAEEGYWRDPVLGLARLLAIVAGGGRPVVSSQGGVIPDVVTALAKRDGVELPANSGGAVFSQLPFGDPPRTAPSKKGSLWLLSFLPATETAGPRLVDADYFPTALPAPEPARS